MTESLLYEKLPDSKVRCNTCQWQCTIGSGKYGACQSRRNVDGKLEVLNYAKVSSLAVDPIEKKPLFHFFPGTEVLSLGTLGCNFQCIHCQNWQISCVKDPFVNESGLKEVSPERTIELAQQHDCAGIAWTYNEPGIWFEYTLDSAKLAKKNELYTVYVTNGYLSSRALNMIGPYLDAWRVDVKGFSDDFYQKLTGVKNWHGILDVAKQAKQNWNMHVEVVTNIIPTMNDDDEQLTKLASWIVSDLGELTPWHVTRYYPQHKLDLPATPVETLEKACDIGKKAGLKFIYTGNVPGHEKENTVCYQCGNTVIRRMGYNTHVTGVDGSKCHHCGAELNIRYTLK